MSRWRLLYMQSVCNNSFNCDQISFFFWPIFDHEHISPHRLLVKSRIWARTQKSSICLLVPLWLMTLIYWSSVVSSALTRCHLHCSPQWPRRKTVDLQLHSLSLETKRHIGVLLGRLMTLVETAEPQLSCLHTTAACVRSQTADSGLTGFVSFPAQTT